VKCQNGRPGLRRYRFDILAAVLTGDDCGRMKNNGPRARQAVLPFDDEVPELGCPLWAGLKGQPLCRGLSRIDRRRSAVDQKRDLIFLAYESDVMPGFDVLGRADGGSWKVVGNESIAERMPGDPHFAEVSRSRQDIDREYEFGWEGNGHDVRYNAAVSRENEGLDGEICDPELR
jgi:hypothetical protein